MREAVLCVKEEILTNVGEKLLKDFSVFAQTRYYFIPLAFCARSRDYHSQYGAVDVTNISEVFVLGEILPKANKRAVASILK